MHILLVPIFICLCAALKLPAKAITVKRGNPLSEGYYAAPADERLICVENGLPDNIFEPGGALARNAGYQRAIDVCSVRSHLTNMACRCVSGDEGEEMICGDGAMTVEDEEQDVMTYCYEACHCPGDRKKIYDATGNLVDFTSLADIEMFGNRTEPASPFQRAIDSLVERLGDECKSPTCTSVSRHCPCGTQCGAPKLTIFFWRSGHCWPTRTQAIQVNLMPPSSPFVCPSFFFFQLPTLPMVHVERKSITTVLSSYTRSIDTTIHCAHPLTNASHTSSSAVSNQEGKPSVNCLTHYLAP